MNVRTNHIVRVSVIVITIAIIMTVARQGFAWTNPTSAPPFGTMPISVVGGNVGIGTNSPISKLQTAGTLTVGSGATAGTTGNVQITTGGSSPISNRLTFGTDGTGWKFAIGKNQGGVTSDFLTVQDNGAIAIGTTVADSNYKITTVNGGIKADANNGQAAGYFNNIGGGPAIIAGTGGITLGGVNQTAWPSGSDSTKVLKTGDTMSGNLNFSNVGIGPIGLYDPTKTQAVWSMGPAYILPAGGGTSNYGALYGLGWSYEPDYGGVGNNSQSKAGLSHQLLVMHSGVTKTAIGNGIWTSGNLTFGAANPTISAASYFIAPGGAYFNSGTVYTEAAIQARGGIHDDVHGSLSILGGANGSTNFSSNVNISTSGGGSMLSVGAAGPVGIGVYAKNSLYGLFGEGAVQGVHGYSPAGIGIFATGGANDFYGNSGEHTVGGVWTNAPSYRIWKEGFSGTEGYLDKLMGMDMYEWQYKDETIDGTNRFQKDPYRHTSPFLDDFYDAFHLGTNDGYNIQDLAGVTIASVKELNKRFIENKDKTNSKVENLIGEIEDLKLQIKSLKK